MRARLSRIRLRDVVLFAVVAGVVAVAALFAAREAGFGGGKAVAEGEPLTLTLTTRTQICETERAGGGATRDCGPMSKVVACVSR